MWVSLVYVLCSLTSLASFLALLAVFRRADIGYSVTRSFTTARTLFDSYAASGNRILLLTGICCLGFVAYHVLLVMDLTPLEHNDLALGRNLVGLAGVGILLFGLVMARS